MELILTKNLPSTNRMTVLILPSFLLVVGVYIVVYSVLNVCIKTNGAITLRPKHTSSKTLRLRFQIVRIKIWFMLVHVYPIMTKIIQITDPDYGPNPNYGSCLRIRDYGPGITDPGLRIRITDPDYESGLRIWITNLDYGSGLRIWITDPDNGMWIAINLVMIG